MTTEAGDKKLLGNFRKLIDQLSADPNYNPANPKLTKTALETQYATGEAAVLDVATTGASNKLAVTERQLGYDDLGPTAIRSRDFLKSSGASKAVVDDAQTYVRKMTGARNSPVKTAKDDPTTPGDESKASHSASQMSNENRLGNFESYIEILKQVPSYNPNEADLKLTALIGFAASLQTKNQAVNTTFAALSQARGLRDGLLYLNDDSVVNTALLVKAYVRAALGADSQLYKQIKGLEFKRRG